MFTSKRFYVFLTLGIVVMAANIAMADPLIQSTSNSRYFEDDSGNVLYITGSHTHDNLQDISTTDPPPVFNFDNNCSSESFFSSLWPVILATSDLSGA